MLGLIGHFLGSFSSLWNRKLFLLPSLEIQEECHTAGTQRNFSSTRKLGERIVNKRRAFHGTNQYTAKTYFLFRGNLSQLIELMNKFSSLPLSTDFLFSSLKIKYALRTVDCVLSRFRESTQLHSLSQS